MLSPGWACQHQLGHVCAQMHAHPVCRAWGWGPKEHTLALCTLHVLWALKLSPGESSQTLRRSEWQGQLLPAEDTSFPIPCPKYTLRPGLSIHTGITNRLRGL